MSYCYGGGRGQELSLSRSTTQGRALKKSIFVLIINGLYII